MKDQILQEIKNLKEEHLSTIKKMEELTCLFHKYSTEFNDKENEFEQILLSYRRELNQIKNLITDTKNTIEITMRIEAKQTGKIEALTSIAAML